MLVGKWRASNAAISELQAKICALMAAWRWCRIFRKRHNSSVHVRLRYCQHKFDAGDVLHCLFVKSVTAILAKHGADTWNEAWVFIVYSLHALWLGIHLAFDPMGVPWPAGSKERALAGTPICNGFRFVLWNLTGDLEYFANTLGMSRWRSHDLCWQCSASKIVQARTWKIN